MTDIAYADPVERIDERAARHAQAALEALERKDPTVALTNALLSAAARLDELSVFVARMD
jgi:hypothetical protein